MASLFFYLIRDDYYAPNSPALFVAILIFIPGILAVIFKKRGFALAGMWLFIIAVTLYLLGILLYLMFTIH